MFVGNLSAIVLRMSDSPAPLYSSAMVQRARANAKVDIAQQLFQRLLENARDVVYRYRVTPRDLDNLIEDLRSGRLDGEIPSHGTVARVRQHIPSERAVGAVPPDDVKGAPVWMPAPAPAEAQK